MSSGSSIAFNGCIENDVPQVREGLQIASAENERQAEYNRIQARTLNTAIGSGSFDVVEDLLKKGDIPISVVEPSAVAQPRSTKIIQLLLDHGWDINSQEPSQNSFSGAGNRLLHYICDSEELTRWALSKGAVARDPHPNRAIYPPLMEEVARSGIVDVFRILHVREGAIITPRVLHCAVEGACRAIPAQRGRRIKMMCYLASNLKFNVNELDSGSREFGPGYGTPLCYAVSSGGSFEVVHEVICYLLAQTADPFMPNRWGVNAVSLAKSKEPQLYELFQNLTSHVEDKEKCLRCKVLKEYK
ncbi:hypothetical protein FQN54_009455 [Arachnomyces sp. PD_36]|nr:hypothetical protein FQN54_009455 [Arachnomyces sp. PD_36]